MRRVRFSCAASLDGYIAGPNGEADWIVMDPEFDFNELYQQFDILLIGRRTFETMAGAGSGTIPGMKTYVVSRTLRQRDYPKITILDSVEKVGELRQGTGKDIWLFGGGLLFRSLAGAGLVDSLEVAVMPVLLGGGIPLYPPAAKQLKLKLESQETYKAGFVLLKYEVAASRGRPRRAAPTKP